MYLYELAIELNQRSSDVARAATALGLGELAAASPLDPGQVAALRAHFSGAPPVVGGAPWTPPPSSPTPGATAFPPPPGAAFPPPPPPPPGVASPAAAPGGRGGLGVGQIAVLAVVAVLVIGLFGWMVTNTGPSEEQKERLEASKKATEPDDASGVLGGGLGADGIDGGAGPTAPDPGAPDDSAPTTTAPATTTPGSGPDPYVPVDRAAFCDGAASVVAFELRFSAAMVEQDRGALLEVLDTETRSWESAVDTMRGGAPPDNHNDIDEYRDGYRELFGIVRSTSTLEEAFTTMGQSRLSQTVTAGQRLTDQIEFACE